MGMFLAVPAREMFCPTLTFIILLLSMAFNDEMAMTAASISAICHLRFPQSDAELTSPCEKGVKFGGKKAGMKWRKITGIAY